MNPDVERLAHRFPLIARPRPACPPLQERISEISRLARDAEHADDPLPLAAQALNKAALIASDCGIPELAHGWCWRHINLYRNAPRLTARQAHHMLEPVVNLARLRLRADAPDAAWAMLTTVHQALATNADAIIEGRPLPTGHLTGDIGDQRELRRWMWGVYLSEGSRALLRQGRWQDAVTHVELNKGIGRHLLDGRQISIIARCLAGDTEAARAILDAGLHTEPWEEQVAACLAVVCQLSCGGPVADYAARMIEQYLASEPTPDHALFRIRLGLTVADLCVDPSQAKCVYEHVTGEALASRDGYAAREVLSHHGCTANLSNPQKRDLTTAVHSSGLGLQAIPASALSDLAEAARTGEMVIRNVLCSSAESPGPVSKSVRAIR
ncbi:hypothetical protein GCM10023259_020740 [Thermocatellispora tengchongensis]